jgi:hypothetical protein
MTLNYLVQFSCQTGSDGFVSATALAYVFASACMRVSGFVQKITRSTKGIF